MNRQAVVIGAGFVFGVLLGFVYGQGVRKHANSAVSTEFKDGVATVHLDTLKLAEGGLRAYLGG